MAPTDDHPIDDHPIDDHPIDDEDARRIRRAWIRDHHPDRGGDPHEFIAGLARFAVDPAANTVSAPPQTGYRPTVYRSRNPVRRALRTARAVRRLLTHQPRSRRLR